MLYKVITSRNISSHRDDNYEVVVNTTTEEEAKLKAEDKVKSVFDVATKAWYCAPIPDVYIYKNYKSFRNI